MNCALTPSKFRRSLALALPLSLLVASTSFSAPVTPETPADPASEPAVIAVNKTWPAVVNINTERIIHRTVQDPVDILFNQFYGAQVRPGRQVSQKLTSLGSGFIVDPAGYIVTNQHVVERAADMQIHVTTTDGKTYEAKYIAGDSKADLALIKIEGAGPFPSISLTDLSPNLLGETVLALGNPLGYGASVSRGILSAQHRDISVEDIEYKNLLQTDAAINPGNSGGPLIDISGKLIGMSSVKMAFTPQGVPTQGLGFAIPASVVRDKVEEFKHPPKITATVTSESALHRCFGINAQDLTDDLTTAFGYAPGMGVLISDVEDGSPAADAGIKRGLVIYKIGRYDITSSKQIEDLLENVKPGTDAVFTVGVVRQIGGRRLAQVQNVSLTAK
ncbi:MAG TPA: trypsin-like peptidase domain-containing protein [Chthoniobacteraceae bacterium]|nr:trypsin-like peptidase domain-containing protein [Chthoniobacteraceae bacterium]